MPCPTCFTPPCPALPCPALPCLAPLVDSELRLNSISNLGILNMQVRYREDLDLVLKGLSLNIKPREKIGIVGRTGCGKSTLMSTLFRIVEPTGGRVLIDGHDLAQVPLHQLRSKLALVPQVRAALLLHDPLLRSQADLCHHSSISGQSAVQTCSMVLPRAATCIHATAQHSCTIHQT